MDGKKDFFPILKNVTIFAGINEETLHKLFDECKLISFEKGAYITKRGEEATEIYIILRGKVKIILNKEDEELDIVELGTGHCIGEASVIGVQHHTASALCIEDTICLELSRKTLMNVSNYNKDLFALLILNIARELARRLHQTDEILLQYSSYKH